MAKRQIPLATPGEILLEEFLKPLGVTPYRLAKEIGVPQRRIGEIVAGKRSITVDTAARLGVFFCMEADVRRLTTSPSQSSVIPKCRPGQAPRDGVN